jgi:hypothetical protein
LLWNASAKKKSSLVEVYNITRKIPNDQLGSCLPVNVLLVFSNLFTIANQHVSGTRERERERERERDDIPEKEL